MSARKTSTSVMRRRSPHPAEERINLAITCLHSSAWGSAGSVLGALRRSPDDRHGSVWAARREAEAYLGALYFLGATPVEDQQYDGDELINARAFVDGLIEAQAAHGEDQRAHSCEFDGATL